MAYGLADSLDQCPMSITIVALIPMPINSSQCWSIPLNDDVKQYWAFTQNIGHFDGFLTNFLGPNILCVDQNWSAMISIERHFVSMPWFWSALGIDRGSPAQYWECRCVTHVTFDYPSSCSSPSIILEVQIKFILAADGGNASHCFISLELRLVIIIIQCSSKVSWRLWKCE